MYMAPKKMIRPRLVGARKAPRRARQGVAQIVKRVLSNNLETKNVGINAVNQAFNSSISTASECYPLIPQVAPGDAGNNRDGDRIKPKYLIVRGHLQYDNTVGFSEYIPPSTVRVMILTQRNIKVASDVSSRADVSHLLKDNVNSDVGRAYTGAAYDNLAPINKDLFKVYMDKKFKMKAQLYTGLGNTSDTNTKTLSGTQQTITFTKKIKCPANLYFDDGNGNTPNNFAPFICMGAVCDDNASPWSANTPYRLVVQAQLYFTDA